MKCAHRSAGAVTNGRTMMWLLEFIKLERGPCLQWGRFMRSHGPYSVLSQLSGSNSSNITKYGFIKLLMFAILFSFVIQLNYDVLKSTYSSYLICLSVCLSVYLICLSVYLSIYLICLSIHHLSIYICTCLSTTTTTTTTTIPCRPTITTTNTFKIFY